MYCVKAQLVTGHPAYARTMPALVRELARLNENLERLAPPIARGAFNDR